MPNRTVGNCGKHPTFTPTTIWQLYFKTQSAGVVVVEVEEEEEEVRVAIASLTWTHWTPHFQPTDLPSQRGATFP